MPSQRSGDVEIMSAGLSTRNKLHAALHPDIHGDVSHVPVIEDRRGSWPTRMGIDANSLFGYKSYREDEEIPEVAYQPNAHGLGTPGEVQRARAMRLENWYRRIAKPLIWAALLGAFFIIGLNVRLQRDVPIPPPRAISYAGIDTRLCVNDWHERCLVCTYLDGAGQRLKSAHC